MSSPSVALRPFEKAKELVATGKYQPIKRGRNVNPERAAKRRALRAADDEARARDNAKYREWYAKNKEKKLAQTLTWSQRNADKVKEYREKASKARKEKHQAAKALKQLAKAK